MQTEFANTRAVWVLIAVVMAVHIALFSLPAINLEWAFSDAARYFETHNQDYLDRYFSVQANSLGIPMLAYVLHRIIPIFDMGVMPRLISVTGFVLLGVSVLRFVRVAGIIIYPALLLAIVFLNPLVWIFGGRGTADFFPAALALFGLSLMLDKEEPRPVVGFLSFSLAIILKYHAVILLPFLWLVFASEPQRKVFVSLWKLGWLSLAVLILPAIFIYGVHEQFGFWLTPPHFQTTHDLVPSLSFAATNFVSYAGYLALMLLPFSMLSLIRYFNKPLAALGMTLSAALIFTLGYFLLTPNGEMNFGPLDAYFTPSIVSAFFAVSAGLLFLLFKNAIDEAPNPGTRRIFLCLAASIIIFIGVLSFTRPAQRYLLFVLPLAYLFVANDARRHKLVTAATLILSIILNTYIGLSQYATGQAAMNLMGQIVEAGFASVTNPGAISGHVGNYFPLNTTENKQYIVVAGHDPNEVLSSESNPFPFVHKAYALVPVKP